MEKCESLKITNDNSNYIFTYEKMKEEVQKLLNRIRNIIYKI